MEAAVERTYGAESVALAKLTEHPRNYRKHTDDQVEHIGQSLTQHGQYRNVVIAKDSTILAGHGVVRAAKSIGWTSVSAIRMDLDPDSPQALKLLAADNELARFAEIDDRELTELLKEVKEFDEWGLEGTGFDDVMLASLVMITRPASEIKDSDAAAEWLGMPDYEPLKNRLKVIVSFDNNEDRVEFCKTNDFMRLAGLDLVPSAQKAHYKVRVWSSWWPEREDDDITSVIFEEADPTSEDQ